MALDAMKLNYSMKILCRERIDADTVLEGAALVTLNSLIFVY